MPFLHFVHKYSLLSDKNILPCLFVLCYNIHGFNTVSHRVRDLQIGCSVALFLYRLTDSSGFFPCCALFADMTGRSVKQ